MAEGRVSQARDERSVLAQKNVNYYRRYSRDYLGDTADLSLAEHGAYCLLLDYYYVSETPMPGDREVIYRRLRAMDDHERRAVDAVLDRFFVLEDDGWHQKRVDHEIYVSQKARSNGGNGGRPKTGTVTGCITGIETGIETEHETGTITGCITGLVHPPTTNHHPPTTNHQKKTLAQADGFARFWQSYPKRKSKGQAEKAWHKLKPNEQLVPAILAGVERAKTSEQWQRDGGQFIPYPATWLNAKGWEDDDGAACAGDWAKGAI